MRNKKFLLILAGYIFLLPGCKKTSADITATCNAVTGFTVTQQSDTWKFNISANSTPLYYEVSVVSSSSNPINGDAGQKYVLNSASGALSFFDLGFGSMNTGQTYFLFVRGACSTSNLSAWIGPKSITIDAYCDKPKNIGFDFYLHWELNSPSNASSFQVQYAIKDFTLGTGTIATTNQTHFDGAMLSANTYYDFYVRSSCSSNLGWSEWTGPYTYYSATNLNLCTVPSNLTFDIQRNGSGQAVGAIFHWQFNGESNFEFTVVNPAQDPNTGTISTGGTTTWPVYSLPQNTNFAFYVRAVCLNGNRTSWAGPLAVNIGF